MDIYQIEIEMDMKYSLFYYVRWGSMVYKNDLSETCNLLYTLEVIK